MANEKFTCPICGADEFFAEPKQAFIVKFENGDFVKQEEIPFEEFKIICSECGAEVDVVKSKAEGQIVLK